MIQSITGIIGGSGLYEMKELTLEEEIVVETPFGNPSAPYVKGKLLGKPVIFLARHGIGHVYNPSEVNYRANIWGFKKLGVDHIFSVSAVGSLRKQIAPGHMVVPDQFIDRTRGRTSTFFERGVVAHVSFAEPFCPQLRANLVDTIKSLDIAGHYEGTYVCMEGPAFSTKAESELYRTWEGDIIGMTNVTEAKLAREAEICYATLALSTDYDCWYDEMGTVSVDEIVKRIHENVAHAQRILLDVVKKVAPARACNCRRSLDHAIMTNLKKAPQEAKTRLSLLLQRFL